VLSVTLLQINTLVDNVQVCTLSKCIFKVFDKSADTSVKVL